VPPRGMGADFGLRITPLTKRVLILLLGLFVGQLVLENWFGVRLTRYLAWHGIETGMFYPWQVVTAYFLNGPSVIQALFDWLVILFFLPPAEEAYGKKGLSRFLLTLLAVSALAGFGLNYVGAVHQGALAGAFTGLNPVITGLIVLFGLTRPNAQILLFFVIPIKAAWIAWGTGLFAFLFFLGGRDLDATLWLSGWVGAYLWLQMRPSSTGLRRTLLQFKQRRIQERLQRAEEERLSQFEVIEGGREDDGPSERKGWVPPSNDDDIVH